MNRSKNRSHLLHLKLYHKKVQNRKSEINRGEGGGKYNGKNWLEL